MKQWLGLGKDQKHLVKFIHKVYWVRIRTWLVALGFKWDTNSGLPGDICTTLHSNSDLHHSLHFFLLKARCTTSHAQLSRFTLQLHLLCQSLMPTGAPSAPRCATKGCDKTSIPDELGMRTGSTLSSLPTLSQQSLCYFAPKSIPMSSAQWAIQIWICGNETSVVSASN